MLKICTVNCDFLSLLDFTDLQAKASADSGPKLKAEKEINEGETTRSIRTLYLKILDTKVIQSNTTTILTRGAMAYEERRSYHFQGG